MNILIKNLVLFLITALLSFAVFGAESGFREPFTLQLHIDKNHGFKAELGATPYVKGGTIYLIKGDNFGVNIEFDGATASKVSYVTADQKSDLNLKFIQNINGDGSTNMMLFITNNTDKTILMDALMTTPSKEGIFKTTILPIQPGLGGVETWPHAIIQLVLENIREQK